MYSSLSVTLSEFLSTCLVATDRWSSTKRSVAQFVVSMYRDVLDLDADVYGSCTNAEIFNCIRQNLEFDQLIWEYGTEDNPRLGPAFLSSVMALIVVGRCLNIWQETTKAKLYFGSYLWQRTLKSKFEHEPYAQDDAAFDLERQVWHTCLPDKLVWH